jgi:hypothetical protein
MSKTLIGKNNILFLCNDSSKELESHCENILKINDISLSRYIFNNYFLFVYPDKSLIYKDYLPDNYVFKYRNSLDIYKKKFQNKLHDLYEILKYENDIYYKTDTHINIKGNYLVYKYFITVINKHFNVNIIPKFIDLKFKICELKTLNCGLGDLTWKSNVREQILDNIEDIYYFNKEINWFYYFYKIQNESNIRFLNYKLIDNTENIEGEIVKWKIISNYIIYIKNIDKINLKVIIFYDSFLLPILPLYFNLFNEIFFIKKMYSNDKINLINPDYIFEFRIERFLN